MPIDCNFIINGRFNGTENWELLNGATYQSNIGQIDADGVTNFGSVLVDLGQELVQNNIYLPKCPNFTLSFAYFNGGLAGKLRLQIENESGDPILDSEITLDAGGWSVYSDVFGFVTDSYKITFSYFDIKFSIDSISLAHIPKTKLELAQETANTLGTELTVGITAPVDENNLGDYTEAVDEGLRWVDAINSQRDADPRCLDPDRVGDCLDRIQEIMATGKVLNYFQTLTDTTLGARSERFSQIARAIREQYGLVAGADDKSRRRFSTIPLHHPRPPITRGGGL